MQLDLRFPILPLYWRLYRMQRLARCVGAPTREQFQEMLLLIEQTQVKTHKWPQVWSSDWYRTFVQSDSWNAHNLCCASELDGHDQEFIHELLLAVLNKGSIPLMDWLMAHLDARTLPRDMWLALQKTNPVVQHRFLVALPHLEELEGPERAPVLTILASLAPHFWLYDHYPWYHKLARQWCIMPPKHWWHELYSVGLHEPPNALRNIPYYYGGQTITPLFPIMGSTIYSRALLEKRRSTILAPDPWAVVRTAFYGDTNLWPPRPIHSPEILAMYVDALGILMQYYPQLLATDFQRAVPDSIRRTTPRLEMLMFLGFSSGPEADREFSTWLKTNNGNIIHQSPGETFALDGLL